MGAPSKLTDTVIGRVCEAIRAGAFREIAAAYAGISGGTFYRWMQEGAEARAGSRKREFYDAVRKAERDLEIELSGRVVLAAKTDWRAAVELLKRRHPDRWGNTTRLVGADGGPVRIVSSREEALKQGRERARHLRAV